MALSLKKSDLREKVRVRRAANLILFAVDASWSMAVAERMEATKGAIMSLLTDAYQRRDRVGLIVFNKNDSNLVLPPTNSVQLAKQALADIAVGGKTPLSAGLMMSYDVFRQEAYTHPDVMPMLILLTDGAGNVSLSDMPPQTEAHRIAELIKEMGVRSVVINMEHAAFDQGLAKLLAEKLDAPATRWKIYGRIRCTRRFWGNWITSSLVKRLDQFCSGNRNSRLKKLVQSKCCWEVKL